MQIVENLKRGNEIVYGYLGVKATTPTARERQSAKINGELGALVESIETDSPAAAAGLKKGDIVVRFNGQDIHDGDEFIRGVGAAPVDDKGVSATIVRGDHKQDLTLKLRRREIAQAAVTKEKQRLKWRGLILGPIPANWSFPSKKTAATVGVMVLGVLPDSPFAKDGIVQGAVITAIAGKTIAGITDLQSLVNELPSEACAVTLAGQDNKPDNDATVVSIRE
jgi:serine protease Do